MDDNFSELLNIARTGRLLIVGNECSGHGDGNEFQRVTAAVLDAAGRAHEFLMVAPERLKQTAAAAVLRARESGGVVIAAGGDGTINTVAQAVLGSGVPFGVLPQGTFNYFGREHGIPEGSEAAAGVFANLTLKPVQVGRVAGRIFLVNASLGLYPQLLEDREAHKKRFGRRRAVALISAVTSLLNRHRQLDLEFESEGATSHLRTLTLFAGNNRLQLERIGIEQAHSGVLERGELVCTVLRPISRLKMLGLILRGALGHLGNAKNVDSFAFRKLTVTPRRQRRMKLGTDGEVAWAATPLMFEVAAEKLLLITPAPSAAKQGTDASATTP